MVYKSLIYTILFASLKIEYFHSLNSYRIKEKLVSSLRKLHRSTWTFVENRWGGNWSCVRSAEGHQQLWRCVWCWHYCVKITAAEMENSVKVSCSYCLRKFHLGEGKRLTNNMENWYCGCHISHADMKM